MENDWVKVYKTTDLYRAEMAKQILEGEGIEAVVMNQKDSTYLIFGEIELFVKSENESSAMQLLKDLEN